MSLAVDASHKFCTKVRVFAQNPLSMLVRDTERVREKDRNI